MKTNPNAEIILHKFEETGKSYKVAYSFEDEFGTASVEQRIERKSLIQFVIDAGLNIVEYFDGFKEDMIQTYTSVIDYLNENIEAVIVQYLTSNLTD